MEIITKYLNNVKTYFRNLYLALINDVEKEVKLLEEELQVLQDEYDNILNNLPEVKKPKSKKKTK